MFSWSCRKAVALCCSLGVGLGVSPAWAEQPAQAPEPQTIAPEDDPVSQAQVMVVVDVSELSTDAEAIEEQVLLRSEYTLEQANLIPSRVPDFMLIRVTIQTGEGGGGYRAELTAEKGGKALETGRSLSCDLCTDSELVISVQRRFADRFTSSIPKARLSRPNRTRPSNLYSRGRNHRGRNLFPTTANYSDPWGRPEQLWPCLAWRQPVSALDF